jgi:hypothetical protein
MGTNVFWKGFQFALFFFLFSFSFHCIGRILIGCEGMKGTNELLFHDRQTWWNEGDGASRVCIVTASLYSG